MELTWRERETLKHLSILEWESEGQTPGGAKTIGGLLEKGWIEKVADPIGRMNRYRITDAGREAQKLPTKRTWPNVDRRLKEAPPRLQEAPSRLPTKR